MNKKYLLRVLALVLPLISFAQSDLDCSKLNPIIENTDINHCEPGELVVLEAKLNVGTWIYWYDDLEASNPVATGDVFDVGYVSSDVSFWVTENFVEFGEEIENQGLSIKTFDGREGYNVETGWGLAFETIQPFIIMEVDIFSFDIDKSEDITIELHDESGNVLETKDFSIPEGGSRDNLKKHTLDLNFEVPTVGKFYLVHTKGRINIGMTNAPNFPFKIGEFGNISDGYVDYHGLVEGKAYPNFYNWKVKALNIICESERIEIKININDDYPNTPVIDSKYLLCDSENYKLADIAIENTHELLWFDMEGNDLEKETLIEEDKVYLVTDRSAGGCISGFAEVTFIFQEISDTPLAETSQTFEEGSGADLTSLEVEGENLRWYADEDKEEELPEDTLLEDGMTYYVSQTLEEHCESDLIGITVTETLGVADVYFEGLEYNNPVQDILYLSNDIEIESVTVYDLSGRQLSVATDKLSSNELRMDLSGLSVGVYFFNLHVNEDTKMIKIVKQ